MASQIQVVARSPYINVEAMEAAKGIQDSLPLLKRLLLPTPANVKRLGCIAYTLFFSWQVIGLVLYSIRAFEAGLTAKHASFQATDITMFRYSEELELVWVVSSIFNAGLVIMALTKVPSFLGYFAILRRLIHLPSFWSLLSLYGMCITGYFLILNFKNDSGMEIALICAFLVYEGSQVALVGFLNFTQVNRCRNRRTSKFFVFFKSNTFLAFLSYFVQFIIGSLQFALDIYGIDDEIGIASDFFSVIGAIRRFTAVVFAYKIYIFFWEKLFVDNRNILCHYDHFASSPNHLIPFTLAGQVELNNLCQ